MSPTDADALQRLAADAERLRQQFVPALAPDRPTYRPSSKIDVEEYELILLWPVALSDEHAGGGAEGFGRLADWVKRIKDNSGGRWTEKVEQFPDTQGKRQRTEYAEWVYFHPFVRKFLYTSRKDLEYQEPGQGYPEARNLCILERSDLKKKLVPHTSADDEADGKDSAGEASRPKLSPRYAMMDIGIRTGGWGEPEAVTLFPLAVQDTQLYVFDTGVAVMALRLVWNKAQAKRLNREFPDRGYADSLTLADVLTLQDCARRVFTPYFAQLPADALHGAEVNPHRIRAGGCPAVLALRNVDGYQIAANSYGSHNLLRLDEWDDETGARQYAAADDPVSAAGFREYREHLEFVRDHKEVYTTPVFRELMSPLGPVLFLPPDNPAARQALDAAYPAPSGLRYEHIEDERLQVMSFLAVDDPRSISPSDWLRIAAVDPAGDSDKHPYSPAFPKGVDLSQFAYDRFWCERTDDGRGADWMSTRWLTCGYSFVAVGAKGSAFFCDPVGGLRAHFRYHYFKLVLIAHFHRASLLRMKDDLAVAVEELHHQRDVSKATRMEQFQDRLLAIEEKLLTFRCMYWFSEVSNQTQGQELFDLLSRHLRTRELFDAVTGEADKAARFVTGHNDRNQADRSARLGVLAAMFLLVAPLVSAVFTTEDVKPWGRMLGAFAASLAAVLIGLGASGWLSRRVDWMKRQGVGLWATVGAALVGVATGTYWFANKPDKQPDIKTPHPVRIVADERAVGTPPPEPAPMPRPAPAKE